MEFKKSINEVLSEQNVNSKIGLSTIEVNERLQKSRKKLYFKDLYLNLKM